MTRAQKWVLAIFLVGGLGFFAGAAYSWWDEHGGTAGTAHVTYCVSSRYSSRSGGGVHCDATWVYKGRKVKGYVENANMKQVGKDISVRIHGTSHVTNTTYWVPIGLGLFGVFELAVFVMILRQFRRNPPPPEADPVPQPM